jgi:outer membrane protein assembly factor BamB
MTKFFLRLVFILSLICVFLPLYGRVLAQKEEQEEQQDPETVPLYECWKFEADNPGKIKIASDNVSTIFLLDHNGVLEAINLVDGKLLWKTDLGGEIRSDIFFEDRRLYLVTEKAIVSPDPGGESNSESEMLVTAVSAETGLPVWAQKFKQPVIEHESQTLKLATVNELLYVIGDTGRILILDKRNGETRKVIKMDFQLSAEPFIFNKTVYFGTTGNTLMALSTETNAVSKVSDLKNAARVLYTGRKDFIFVGDGFGAVYAYSLLNGKVLWQVRTGAEISGIQAEHDSLYISSNDNFIYCLSVLSGNIIWKKRLAGRNEFTLLNGKEKSLMFVVTLNSDLFVVGSLLKGRTVNRISLPEDDYFVGRPLVIGDSAVVPTSFGLRAYSLFKCS